MPGVLSWHLIARNASTNDGEQNIQHEQIHRSSRSMDTIKKKMLSSNSDTTLGENMHIRISNIDMASLQAWVSDLSCVSWHDNNFNNK